MDYKNEYEQLIQQLRDLGFDEEKLNQLLDLAIDETVDLAVSDLSENLDEQILAEIAEEIQKEIPDKEKAKKVLDMIFQKGYGEKAEQKKYEYMNQYLRETLELAKNSKELMDKYNQGDPTAVASVQANMNNPDTEDIKKYLNKE